MVGSCMLSHDKAWNGDKQHEILHYVLNLIQVISLPLLCAFKPITLLELNLHYEGFTKKKENL